MREIENDPAAFAEALLFALRVGGTCKKMHDPDRIGRAHLDLRRVGAAIKHQRHHSDPCPTGVPS